MLKKLMDRIHNRLEMPALSRDFGTQTYEQQVVELSQDGERGKAWAGTCLVGAFGGGAQPGAGRSLGRWRLGERGP